MNMIRKLLPPFGWIVVYQLIAYVIGLVTRDNMGWYDTLAKPALTPPDIVFPIVWSLLYVMLALAGWWVWSECRRPEYYRPFRLYWLQMVLNWAWSFVFFEFHMVALGFWWIVALNLAMLAFIVSAWKVERPAALLVLPTLVWGCFAGYLNGMIWILN